MVEISKKVVEIKNKKYFVLFSSKNEIHYLYKKMIF